MPGKIDLSKMKTMKQKIKNKQSEKRKQRRVKKDALAIGKSNNPSLDWDKFDERGESIISFDLDDEQRKKILGVLKRNDKKKKNLMEKLQAEFIRLYSNYRKSIIRALGQSAKCYEVRQFDNKYGARAAVHCIKYGITPKKLFMYWHHRSSSLYGNEKMKVPQLSFLSNEFCVKAAADSIDESDDIEQVVDSVFGNDFSELNKLDGRVRSLLNKKWNLENYTDRELLTVQVAARALALGHSIYIDDEIFEMVKYLSDKLYKNLKESE